MPGLVWNQFQIRNVDFPHLGSMSILVMALLHIARQWFVLRFDDLTGGAAQLVSG